MRKIPKHRQGIRPMRKAIIAAAGLSAAAALGGGVAPVPAEAVTVSAESVTVPGEAVTASAESVTISAEAAEIEEAGLREVKLARERTRRELVKAVRNTGRSEKKRVASLKRVWNQDDVFRLFFKPGEDRNAAVRAAAIGQIAEIDVVKRLAAGVEIPEVAAAAEKRLKSVFASESDRRAAPLSNVARDYAQRMTLGY